MVAGALYIEAAERRAWFLPKTPKIAEAKSGVPEITKNPSVWTLMRKNRSRVFPLRSALVAILMTLVACRRYRCGWGLI